MVNVRRINQCGSSIVFVIVGIVLTIGLIAMVFFINQRGEIARKERAIAAYDESKAKEDPIEVVVKEEVVNTGDVKNQKSDIVVPSLVSELPVTGSEFSSVELLGLGLITMAMVGYVLSRRNLLSYL